MNTAVLRVTRLWIAAGVALVLTTLGFIATPMAHADTSPPAGTPATVSADGLPTWQVNGVVWAQVTVGNTVYATGNFATARPPGVGVGGAGQVAAGNIFAYDIRTGNRVASFSHSLNGQGLSITASPDGSRVYVGGDFTTVDGASRPHIAAFDTASGALSSSFQPSISNKVAALVATNSTVYAGGAFFNAEGKTRRRLASFNASNGALQPWAPQADDNNVAAMVMAPDGSRLIIGGSFTTLNGVSASGMGAVSVATGATLAWAANQQIRLGGTKSGVTTLRADGNQIYGAGFAFGTGNFEGAFAADPLTGNIIWANDCHGDTYDVLPLGQTLYTVSHAHNCSMIGAFPQTNQNWAINMRHALAFTTYPTGMNAGPDDYGWDFRGVADSTLLQWYPELAIGTATGQNQAAWSLTGNDQYLAAGGEFPKVNGAAQQGLVRFAVHSAAPNKRGPVRAPGAPTPSALAMSAGSVRVGWQSAYDMDNASLRYDVYRSGTTAPVYSVTGDSNYWTYPGIGFQDKGLTAGNTYTYSIKVTDPDGNTLTLPKTNSVMVTAGSTSAYAQDVTGDGATAFWRLGEGSGSAVYDYANFNDATASSGVGRGAAGPISGDSTTASTFDGSLAGLAASNAIMDATPSLSIETWFKTSTTSGGKLVGYGNSATGNSSSYDRHIYMDNAGHLIFGVYTGATRTVSTSKTYNDGQWHHVVATLSSTAGMALFADGKKVGADPGTTSAQGFAGYWRIGGDNLGGWPQGPSSSYFAGTIGNVAIYPSALSLGQVQTHYADGGGTVAVPPKPTDAYGKAVYGSDPAMYWRLGEATGPTAFDVSPSQSNGTYSGGVTYGLPGAVSGTADTAVALNGSDGTIGSVAPAGAPSVYSEELWFNTTTQQGGKLIGYGDQQSGNSNNYDRHVYMETSGQLDFGVWTGSATVVQSPSSYNDGKWHQVVATQGSDGMRLYVDGVVVGTNPETQAQPYQGYWRVGGDTSWSGSNYFAGSIDEVAVYAHVLSASDVQAHFAAGGGTLPNQAPVAAFTSKTDGLKVSVDGSGSSDADGTVASYAWDFGDGSTGTGATTSHTFGAAGTYSVKLTVMDNDGAQSTVVSHDVTVTAPPANQTVASDTFTRVTKNGWGTADVGGPWTLLGSGSNFATANGVGTITMPKAGAGPSAYLKALSQTSTDTTVTVSESDQATGTGTFVSLIGRQIEGVGSYRAVVVFRTDGQVSLGIFRVDNAGQATVVPQTIQPGLTYQANEPISVRFQVSGTAPTTLSAKAWKSGTAEPTAWLVAGTDVASPMQAAGSVGLMSYLSGTSTVAPVTTSFDSLVVQSGDLAPAAAKMQAMKRTPDVAHKSVTPSEATRVSPPFGK